MLRYDDRHLNNYVCSTIRRLGPNLETANTEFAHLSLKREHREKTMVFEPLVTSLFTRWIGSREFVV